jgi:hypothetical protein
MDTVKRQRHERFGRAEVLADLADTGSVKARPSGTVDHTMAAGHRKGAGGLLLRVPA